MSAGAAALAAAVLILSSMRFRERLLATLREMQPILDVPGVMVGGSQVPNLLEPDAAATLVVSQDVDLVVPVGRHGEVKAVLEGIRGYSPAPEMPDPTAARGDVARLIERLEAVA